MKFILNLIMMTLLMSCGSSASTIVDNLENARIAVDNGDYSTARSLCDEVRTAMLDKGDVKADMTSLCNLSILYMRIADYTDRDDNIDYARQCYIKAYSLDSVGARNYYDNLGVSDMACGNLLSNIVNSTLHPQSVPGDSIFSVCVEDDSTEYVQP
jgi:hypothetical protein